MSKGQAVRRAFDMSRAGAGLPRVLERSLKQAAPGDAPILAWPLACGSSVALRTQATGFGGGVLRVEVPDEGWRRELMSLAPRYLAAINRYVPDDVTRIEFVVSPR